MRSASLLLAFLAACATAADGSTYLTDVRPLLEAYCFKCHSPEKHKGDLDLASIKEEEQGRKSLRVWRKVIEKVVTKDMPPEDAAKQPTPAEAEKLVTALRTLKHPSGPPDPGVVTIRRLNRNEYDNTIRDLIGLDLKPAAGFPTDDVGEGFDNIGDVLSLPPLLLEKYHDAATMILDKAIVIEQVDLKFTAGQLAGVHDGKPLEAKPDGKARTFTTLGEVDLDTGAPVEGKYTLKIRAGAEQAGNEASKMVIKVDNEVASEIKVMATLTYPSSYTSTLTLKKGGHHIAVCFANPHNDSDPPAGGSPGKGGSGNATAKAAKPAKPPAIRSLMLDQLELIGPPAPPIPESHKRIFIAKPSAEMPKRDAARAVIERFATRAFRQPVTPEKLERLLKLFDLADRDGEVFEEAIKLTLKAVLESPLFLFRVEQSRQSSEPNGAYPLNDWELASRLSYFLWSSMPDDELFELAKQGKLRDPATLEKQVRRMIKDGKSHALTENFAEQWLHLRNLDTFQPDPKKFPEYDKALKKSMYDETTMFFENILREDRSILEFIDCDYTFVNERLASHYGIPNITGPTMRKVQLSNHNRGGVLSMASILTITSNPTRTSPVKRGKWILEEIVGDPPPPPPPAVAQLPEQDKGSSAGLSLRQLMERHRTDPICASCHSRMDPIGFGFENYDALGRWRTEDGGKALDVSGTLPGGASFKGPIELKSLFLSHKDDFTRRLSEKMLIFALGRGMINDDDLVIDAISSAVAKDQYHFDTMITQVVKSYPFLYRRNK